MLKSLFVSQYFPNLLPQRLGLTTYKTELREENYFNDDWLTVFAIFFRPWYSFFSRMLFLFKSKSLNFHSTTWWSPILPFAVFDLECSVWKMLTKAVLKPTRSLGVHFFLGALLLAGDDRFWFPFPAQLGRPCFVWVFWIGLPWPLTHQQPLFSRHWIGAYDPSSRHFGTNFIFGRCESA